MEALFTADQRGTLAVIKTNIDFLNKTPICDSLQDLHKEMLFSSSAKIGSWDGFVKSWEPTVEESDLNQAAGQSKFTSIFDIWRTCQSQAVEALTHVLNAALNYLNGSRFRLCLTQFDGCATQPSASDTRTSTN